VEHLRHYQGGVALSQPISILSQYDYEDPGGDVPGDRTTDCPKEEEEERWEEGEPKFERGWVVVDGFFLVFFYCIFLVFYDILADLDVN